MSKEQILDYIKKVNMPVGAADVSKALGIEKEIVSKAFDQLKKEGLIISPVRCKYQAK